MTAMTFRSDPELFAIARTILSGEGFADESVRDGDAEVLLAENHYFIVALCATATIDDLIAAEPVVEQLVRGRLDQADVGPKVWDAYVVLLTQERPAEDGTATRPLFGINYDTRGFRRLARAGVEPTVRGVRGALTPFVEPVQLSGRTLASDPFASLAVALVTHGIDAEFAARSVQIFQQGGRIDDVL